ncbi:type II toxin-antitoxin system VapC family toxin [Candidatus Daviesbacteria bacterium]|nr:type II toxin-antitoxin system VapC family toxin [Candidatus Daviesbacteria bacterium]
MKLLVDTHVFLWIIFSPKKISSRAKDLLFDPEIAKYISAITFWEVSLKYQLGKLKLTGVLPDELPVVAQKAGFEILNLDADTASTFYQLPKFKDQDPFDRMLAWQAIRQDYHLLTKDLSFADYRNYGLKTIW